MKIKVDFTAQDMPDVSRDAGLATDTPKIEGPGGGPRPSARSEGQGGHFSSRLEDGAMIVGVLLAGLVPDAVATSTALPEARAHDL